MTETTVRRMRTCSVDSEIVKGRRNSSYTDAEIEHGLTVVALASGNYRRAEAELKEEGMPIPRSTLHSWATDHYIDRYHRIYEEKLPHLYEQLAQGAEAAADRFGELEMKLADKIESSIEDMRPDQIAGALRNVTVAKAVNMDKASVIRGRPTEIRENRNASQLLGDLHRKFPGLIRINPDLIEGSAEEVE